MAERNGSIGTAGGPDGLPTDRLKDELRELLRALGKSAVRTATSKVGGVAGKLPGVAQEAGKSLTGGGGAAGAAGAVAKKVVSAGAEGVKERAKEALGGGGGKGGKQGKAVNIVEAIDVGVPVSVAYNQWTRFTDFPGFTKKVENVEQESDTEVSWRAKILWSHRNWKSTIIDQVPDERIVWRSEGAKGYVDGAVTFHALTPNLTRILVVLEYYPQGFFEKVGNIWRAQGRRARLELKHYQRHVMTEVVMHPDEVEGWRGEIHDGEVVEAEEEAEAEAEAEEEEEERPEPEPEPEPEERPRPRRKAAAGRSAAGRSGGGRSDGGRSGGGRSGGGRSARSR